MCERFRKDKESLEQSIHDLEETISDLRGQIQAAKEHEKLLIQYPDLNGPVNPDLSGM